MSLCSRGNKRKGDTATVVSSFCCIVEAAQIFPEIFGTKNEKVITLIAFSILIKKSKLMKAFLAGICLFFATLVSCQQKGEGFTSVSADEFATLIADTLLDTDLLAATFLA